MDIGLNGRKAILAGANAGIGRAVAFIASPACRHMTGANVVIDGGMTKRVQY